MTGSQFFGRGRPSLQDRIDIADVISSVTFYGDCGEWSNHRELYCDDATLDYSRLFGDLGLSKIDDFLQQVESFLPGFDATQHMVTNFDIRVDNDRGISRSHVHGIHWIDDRVWSLRGVYNHDLIRVGRGWKIQHQVFKPLFESGDRNLIEEAAVRVSEGRVRKKL
jgi:hypothetical protein